MKRTAVILFFAAVFGALAGNTTETSFAGTWEAKLKDKVFCVLAIAVKDGKLVGAMSAVNISADDDGNLIDAEPAGPDLTLRDIKFENDRITFVQPDGDDVTKCEIKLTGDGAAELRFLDPGPDILKPVQLRRR